MKTAIVNLRINILGAKGVGKSAIIVRYLTRRFIGEYSSGVDVSYQTAFTHGDVDIKVDFLDTSNQDESQAACHDVYSADGFVVVYSVTDAVSLKVAKREVERIRSKLSSAPILLLGNKLDLDHARKVLPEDVNRIKEAAVCQHTEVSAAECCLLISNSLQGLIIEALNSIYFRGRRVKRRSSLLENMSRKLVKVFRRKSLEEPAAPSKKATRIFYQRSSRRSV